MSENVHRAVDLLVVDRSASLGEILRRHDSAGRHGLPAGIALVVDDDGRLIGTVSDGDVRRALLAGGSLESDAAGAMRTDPIVFDEGMSYRQILRRLPEELTARGRRSRRFLGKIVLIDDTGRPSRVLDYHQLWEQRVATHRHVVVVGMGYVGLTLALVLAEEGFYVTGVDTDEAKIERLAACKPHVHEVGLPELLREQLGDSFEVSTELPEGCDVLVLAVGTPVVQTEGGHEPVLDILVHAAELAGRRLSSGGLVVLRSTVPVGTTREVVLPILERESGLRGGVDFHLSFAPERTAEGLALKELRSLPQIIGGLNDDSVEATAALFRELTPTIVRMECLEAAELAKLVNNAFRDLSFAFANNVAQLASPFNFDVVEAIAAANRAYPRNAVPLPSPGVGGPCLTKDPHILSAVGTRAGLTSTLFSHGRDVNEAMPPFVADAVIKQLEAVGKDARDCTVLLCGLAFKGEPETGDLRESTALDVAACLEGRVGRLLGHDPVVDAEEIAETGLVPVELLEGVGESDAVLFLNNHRTYQTLDVFEVVRTLRSPPVLYDGWHLFRPDDVLQTCPSVYMGLGFTRSSLG